MLNALFIDEIAPPDSSHHIRKHPYSSQTYEETKADKGSKRLPIIWRGSEGIYSF